MATLSLTGGTEQFSWQITGLSSAFGKNNGYLRAGITRYPFTQSSPTISGVVDSVSAPATGTANATTRRTVDYTAGTHPFWGFTQIQDGTYWPAGSGTVTVEPAAERPEDWDWWSTVAAGAPIQLSAAEFQAFLERINAFRVYTGLPEYGAFVYPSAGESISAAVCKHTVWAISAMDPPVAPPATPASGDLITAAFFTGLRDALNSIP